MLIPLFILSIGAIFSAGFLFKNTFIGHHSNDFWQTSIFFLNEIKHEHIPLMVLINHTCFSCNFNTYIILLYIFLTPNIFDDFKNTNYRYIFFY